MDRSCFLPLVCIAPIQSSESTNLHLVAVTGSGVRLYFSALHWRSYNEPSSRPVTLQLVQVLLPPGYASPHQVHSALYSHGTTFLVTSTASDDDVVWTFPNSLFPAARQLSETQNTMELDGKTWALAEVAPKRSSASVPPTIDMQHSAGPRKFIFLTPKFCHIVTQLRPVDILRQLLLDASGPDSKAVRAFFLKEDQACATALILACSSSVQDSQLADWATRAFFLHVGDAKIAPVASSVMSPVSPSITSPSSLNSTPGLQQSYSTFTLPVAGGSNAFSTPFNSPSSSSELEEFQFSAQHNGLYLYLGRILRPVWLMQLTRDVGEGQLLDSIVTSEELISLLDQLNALKRFVHANHQTGLYQTNKMGHLQVKNKL